MSRELPKNREAEKVTLGCALIEAETVMPRLEEITKSADFYFKAHQWIYEALSELYEERQPVDPVIVGNWLEEKDVLPEVGGRAYLSDLISAVTTTTSVSYYADIIADKATRRRAIQAAEEISDIAYDERQPTDDALDRIEQRVLSVVDRSQDDDYEAVSDIVDARLDDIKALGEHADGITGVPAGFPDLDRETAGWQDQDLIVLAGRPSMGKTAFACSMAYRIGVNQGRRVGIFSLEMSQDQVVDRLMALGARVDLKVLSSGKCANEGEPWDRVKATADQLQRSRISVDDTPTIPILQLKARARRMAREQGLDILFVDYLQLIEGSESGADNRAAEVAYIARTLKGLARELDIPIVLVSQLNRDLERRPNKQPRLADLRESGEIEQTADAVIFVYREDYYSQDDSESEISKAELILAKQRNGPTGLVSVAFHRAHAGFELLEPESVF